MKHLGPEECPLCWRFDCRCWEAAGGGHDPVMARKASDALAAEMTALAAAARKGGDVKQAPGEAPQSGGDSRNAQNPESA